VAEMQLNRRAVAGDDRLDGMALFRYSGVRWQCSPPPVEQPQTPPVDPASTALDAAT
jgi:hypothetical protein